MIERAGTHTSDSELITPTGDVLSKESYIGLGAAFAHTAWKSISSPFRQIATAHARMRALGSLATWLDEAGFVGEYDCLHAVAKVELREHAVDVRLHGRFADNELDGNNVRIAKTASRSTLGFMNEMAFELEWHIARNGGLHRTNIDELNHALRRMLPEPPRQLRPPDRARQPTPQPHTANPRARAANLKHDPLPPTTRARVRVF